VLGKLSVTPIPREAALTQVGLFMVPGICREILEHPRIRIEVSEVKGNGFLVQPSNSR
jgi:hypothetical protein